jgi:MFS family permease
MIEIRLGLDPSQTQRFTTAMLFILGLIAVPAAPIIGHFADKTTSRKIPLLISLLGCTVGTVLVAWTPSVLWVYAGRIIQGIAGTGAWIIGFTMLTDAAGPEHLGKALGLAGSFITAGVITGPAISGALFQWFGYWWAWAVPLALLAVDVVARLAMSDISGTSQKSSQVEPQGENEDDPLLQPCTSDGQTAHAIEEPSTEKAQGFYRIMLSQSTVWVGLFSVTAFAIILAGFDATLPVHLRNAFGWNPAAVGAIFLGLQVPGMFLSPFIGGLRDRVGLRWPTTLGWILLTPLLWLSGTPGTSGFPHLPWGSDEGAFIACIISIGLVSVLVRGAGTFQLTCKFPAICLAFVLVPNTLTSKFQLLYTSYRP